MATRIVRPDAATRRATMPLDLGPYGSPVAAQIAIVNLVGDERELSPGVLLARLQKGDRGLAWSTLALLLDDLEAAGVLVYVRNRGRWQLARAS